MCAYNNYLKSTNIPYDIKEMGICTAISGDSEVTAVFGGGDELNVCGDVFALKDCPKLNDKRFPMGDKISIAQKMFPRCSSNYHLGFVSMFDTAIALIFFNVNKEAKKNVKKSSAAKPNQETSLAQVVQKRGIGLQYY